MVLALVLGGVLLAAPGPGVGEKIQVEKETTGPLVALFADVAVNAAVHGDVVALLGDVRVGPAGSVQGDVVAVGGRVVSDGRVSGRAVALGDWARHGSWRVRLGVDLLRTGCWLIVSWALLLLFPRAVRQCTRQVDRLGARLLLVGVLALGVWLAAMLIAVVLTSSPLGAGLLLLGVGALVTLKAFGLAGLALALGRRIARRLPTAWRGEVSALACALCLLLVVSALPVVGSAAWRLVSVLGVAVASSALLAARWSPAAPRSTFD